MTPAGQFTTLWRFSYTPGQGYVQGYGPVGTLTQGPDGSFYGATQYGGGTAADRDNGTSDGGTVFRITPQGRLTSLIAFPFGYVYAPTSGVTFGPDGLLYGTTRDGGLYDYGTVYRINANGSYTVLNQFTNYGDGAIPLSPPTSGGDGWLYGTTSSGGVLPGSDEPHPAGTGTLYKVKAGGDANGFVTYVHTFDSAGGQNAIGGLTLGANGALYGVTSRGGINDGGVAFKFVPDSGLFATGTFTVLHKFSTDGHGTSPSSNLTLGPDGNLYGTTPYGGTDDRGTVFQMTPAGAVTTLYKFHTAFDGTRPAGSVTFGPDGALYGTTRTGGANGYGTIYRLTLPQ